MARFLAACAPHSGDWLLAFPISSCGLRLSDNAVRVAVALRLGCSVSVAHSCCKCGTLADAQGLHGLVCKKTSSKAARHHAVNDLIAHTFTSAGIPISKEPVGLKRWEGKCPDGLMLIPWQGSKPVCWDVTVISTLADSYLYTSAHTAGGAADLAASRKEVKYANLPSSYTFQPLAFETLGPLSATTRVFLTELGSSAFSIHWRTTWDCLSFSVFVYRCSKGQRCSDSRNLWFIRRPTGPLAFSSFFISF